ncbi:MAG TPA: glycosyltransferase [Candidatus Acidoferrales bacterium]|nr:glycosyltransferase [Candidatus Acidoferrales bacterium]
MKILIASDTYHPDVNGAAYFSYRLATILAARNHDVSVICPSLGLRKRDAMQEGVRVFGVQSFPLDFLYPDMRFSPPLLAKRSIRKFLRKNRPDVIHIQNHFLVVNAVFEVAKELGIPIMGTNHMMPENIAHHLHLPPKAEFQVGRYLWARYVQIYKHLSIVTAPTATAAKLSTRPGLGKEVIPVSCGIDLKRFHPKKNGRDLKNRFKIPDRLILLAVGRLDEEKRVEVIIRAMPEIIGKVDAHLVVAGKGKLIGTLKKMVRELGISDRVTFTGFLPDDELPELYRLADVFVMPGIAELQSIATMEAMASGLPVIAANAMALPELVHDGENGFLFAQDDSAQLAEAAIKILSDEPLRNRMAKKSLEIIQVHDINKVVETFERLYEQVVGVESHAAVAST